VDTASQEAMRAVQEARGRDRPTVLCFSLAYAASFVFLSLGELDTAERFGGELIRLGQKHALRPYHAVGLCVRGSLAARRTDPNTAVDMLRRGLADLQAAGYLVFYPYFQVELAAALGTASRVDDGLAEIDAALRFAAETGHRWFVPETLRVKGELLALRGPAGPVVEDCFYRGSEVAREQDALFWELRLAVSLARLRIAHSRDAEARGILAPVYDRFTEGLGSADLQAARTMLDGLSS
jgi:non-specific serine/threonine protein kinase